MNAFRNGMAPSWRASRCSDSQFRKRGLLNFWPSFSIKIFVVCIVYSGLLYSGPSNADQKFGEDWGPLDLPVAARVGIIDESDEFEVGLSAMQLDNVGHSGEYKGLIVKHSDNTIKAKVYNAFGMQALRESSSVRISSALAMKLGCKVGDNILIEGLAVDYDENRTEVFSIIWKWLVEKIGWLWTAIFVPFIGWGLMIVLQKRKG